MSENSYYLTISNLSDSYIRFIILFILYENIHISFENVSDFLSFVESLQGFDGFLDFLSFFELEILCF